MQPKPTSQLSNYTEFLDHAYGLHFQDYDALHLWSISNQGVFWESISRFFDVSFDSPYKKVFMSAIPFWESEWFCGSQLSYAKHIFKHATEQHPALIFQNESEEFVPASIVQWYIDSYAEQFAAEKMKAMAEAKKSRSYVAPKNNLVVLWAKTAAKYSKFTATGSPDLTATPGAGTGHCLFTAAQWLAAADLMVATLKDGKFPLGGKITTTARKVGLSYDTKFRVPLFKSLQ